MTLIQPVLIILVLAAVIAYEFRMRSRLVDRLVVVALGGLGIILIGSPNLSTDVARVLGVGRGVDVVIYLSLLGVGFLQLVAFSKIRSMEGQITALVREIALHAAETGPVGSPRPR